MSINGSLLLDLETMASEETKSKGLSTLIEIALPYRLAISNFTVHMAYNCIPFNKTSKIEAANDESTRTL
jgi:hypothetical protein